ncbi:HAD family hydrolase [Streptomyces sp. NPDC056491]|uniref:HAD family hydrolase n=1 Tax=Streptomyces sp. NPDC056491 TaxID=3345837 RepID=UPI00367981D7
MSTAVARQLAVGERPAGEDSLTTSWARTGTTPRPVAELLRSLSKAGWKVPLVTSANREPEAVRDAVGADGANTDTAISGDVEQGKRAPDHVQHALDRAALPPGGVVFVGDSVRDMKAARGAGVAAVGLLCGEISREDFEEAEALSVYRDPADLLAGLGVSPFSGACLNPSQGRASGQQTLSLSVGGQVGHDVRGEMVRPGIRNR